jgi:hypothetical protein
LDDWGKTLSWQPNITSQRINLYIY